MAQVACINFGTGDAGNKHRPCCAFDPRPSVCVYIYVCVYCMYIYIRGLLSDLAVFKLELTRAQPVVTAST